MMQNKKIALDQSDRDLAVYARALGHPVRVYIMKKLSVMNACCYSGDLVEELPIGRSTLSQHLKELKHAGFIKGEIEAPYIKYCINREKWDEVKAAFAGFFSDTVMQKAD